MNIDLVFAIKKMLIAVSGDLSTTDIDMLKGILDEIQTHKTLGVSENGEADEWLYKQDSREA
jgi:hypothetical protein